MICSVAEIKQYLKLPSDYTASDSFITELINASTNSIEAYLRYAVESGTRTKYFNNPAKTIVLRENVVTSVTGVYYRTLPSESWTLISSGITLFESELGFEIYCNNGFDYPYYKVVYVGGYSSVPSEIKAVCIEQTAIRFIESNVAPAGISLGLSQFTETQNGITKTKQFKDLIPKWEQRLYPFKLLLT